MNSVDICQELHKNFIDFSYEANSERAFADARDGLKPGQRACIWEMFVKGYLSSKPHVKSAKISGGVIATWHPHGDVAVYETFARMSQPWINNIPEVDWHGANGSIVMGSSPASSRYTEARLSKATEDGMLQGIKKNNVPMKLNFSEDEEMPTVLPAIFPRLLVNGCQGIGVSIANVWVPHNLTEVAAIIENYIKTQEIDYSALAPDFPTGGTIINKNELSSIYTTGKGKVVVRGVSEIKNNSILITELPYQIYVEPFIDSIKDLIKKEEISGIKDILNKTDKKRMLIEIECEKNPASVLNQLYNLTDLQKTFNPNHYALVGKTPRLLTLKEYFDLYIQHNKECIVKEFQFDLTKASNRKEIVDGLLIALEDIDNIIALIKKSASSQDAKEKLKEKYSFTEAQALAIVNMRLGKLANLEKIELQNEKAELEDTILNCLSVIENEEKQTAIFLERLSSFVKKYGFERKTKLDNIAIEKVSKEEAAIVPEEVMVIVTENNLIKKVPLTSFKVQKRGGKGIKNKDGIIKQAIKTNTVDTLLCFSNLGQMYRLSINDIPTGTNTSKGTPINSLISANPNEEILNTVSLFKNADTKYIIFFTKKGFVKKSLLTDYVTGKRKTGISAISLRDGDSVQKVSFLNEEAVVIVSQNGYGIKFESSEVSSTGRATQGVKGINLEENDSVLDALPIRHETDNLCIVTKSGYGKQMSLNELPIQGRGGKGLKIVSKDQTLGGIALVEAKDDLLIMGTNSSICISATDFPQLSRTSLGNVTIGQPNSVLAIVKI